LGGARDGADLAIGMGCELKHAGRLSYARGLDLAAPLVTPVGPACRLCERAACMQRAAAPLSRTLAIDEHTRALSPYPFSAA
jgi:predicted transcriptional regulator